ncbi:MAG: 16S rRNA (uracil(1498)-N(3))-methyltransferase [Pseudomonadota bacterium]
MASLPRLHVDVDLAEGARIVLDRGQSHYLLTVMRRSAGDEVRVFNGRDGEWRARVESGSKREARLSILDQHRVQHSSPDVELLFAPVKKARTDFIVEKAVELGAARLRPVLTERTITDRVRTDRLNALAREAAEQTERLDLAEVCEPVRLPALLEGWDDSRWLIFCDEAGDDAKAPWGGETGRASPMLDVLRRHQERLHLTPALRSRGGAESEISNAPGDSPWAILVGPEGGFTPRERVLLREQPFVLPVTLGPRILRADTAAAAALSLWQAVLGDWGALTNP